MTPAPDIFGVNEPDLLGQIYPFRLQEHVRILDQLVILWRPARLDIHVDELDRIVLQDIARVGVAAEHHLGGLLLPNKQRISLQGRLFEYQMRQDQKQCSSDAACVAQPRPWGSA